VASPSEAASLPPRTALVLSGGGMFGAWQAGAWSALSEILPADLVVGTSIGSLNAWLIAGGAPAEELAARWLNLGSFAKPRLRLPWPPGEGLCRSDHLLAYIKSIFERFHPVCEIGITTTELPSFRPCLHRNEEITWRHLAAACAVLGLLPQQRLHGRMHSDGGLFNALPAWAAWRMGADRVVAINVMPRLPAVVRMPLLALRRLKGVSGSGAAGRDVFLLNPEMPLGGWRELTHWSRANTERWLAEGRQAVLDRAAALTSWLAATESSPRATAGSGARRSPDPVR